MKSALLKIPPVKRQLARIAEIESEVAALVVRLAEIEGFRDRVARIEAETTAHMARLAEITTELTALGERIAAIGESPAFTNRGATPIAAHSFERLLRREIAEKDLEIVFHLHIPKTAGKTVNSLLRQAGYTQIDLYPPTNNFFHWLNEERWFECHEDGLTWRPHFFTGHFRLDHPIFSSIPIPYATVTVLRHPFDRTVSNYNFTLLSPGAPWHDEVVNGRMSFFDFAAKSESVFGPQYSYFDDSGQGMPHRTGIATAPRCLENLLTKVSFYGFTERLAEFAVLLGYLLGAGNVFPIGARNRTVDLPDACSRPLKLAPTTEEREFLEKLLGEDIWFYEAAQKAYQKRLTDPRLQYLLKQTVPLVQAFEQASTQLLSLEDPARQESLSTRRLAR